MLARLRFDNGALAGSSNPACSSRMGLVGGRWQGPTISPHPAVACQGWTYGFPNRFLTDARLTGRGLECNIRYREGGTRNQRFCLPVGQKLRISTYRRPPEMGAILSDDPRKRARLEALDGEPKQESMIRACARVAKGDGL